jgi:hypothetical protein
MPPSKTLGSGTENLCAWTLTHAFMAEDQRLALFRVGQGGDE